MQSLMNLENFYLRGAYIGQLLLPWPIDILPTLAYIVWHYWQTSDNMDSGALLIYVILASAVWLMWRQFCRRDVNHVLDNLPGPPSMSFVKGNLEQFFNRHGTPFQQEVSLNYGPVVKLHGLFGRPVLFVRDPKAMHTIVLKEEQIFEESDSFILTNKLVFGPGLLSTLGEQHRKQRKMLNPVFSVNHMRDMLPIFYNVTYKLRDAILAQVQGGQLEIDMLEWTGRAALEIIGQGGLGHSFDPLVENTKNAFGDALKSLFPAMISVDLLQRLLPYVHGYGPAWLGRLALNMFPNVQVQKIKSISDLMSKKSVEIFEGTKAAIQKGDNAVLQHVGEGKDIMSILFRANSAASENEKLPEEELIAQMSTLIFAGMDTTSNTLVHILQLLAEHKDVQDKLREEILETGAARYLPYDELMHLPLLNAVCRETLRLCPAGSTVMRVPTKDTVLPLSKPIVGLNGKMINEIPISRGTEVLLGLWASNIDPSLWGHDSLEWKPQRWLSPLPDAVTNAQLPGVFSNLMTFMGGKRACIGFKFSEMEMKAILAVLLSTFVFEPSGKPIEWNAAGIFYPTVGKNSDKPELPLKIKLYNGGKV